MLFQRYGSQHHPNQLDLFLKVSLTTAVALLVGYVLLEMVQESVWSVFLATIKGKAVDADWLLELSLIKQRLVINSCFILFATLIVYGLAQQKVNIAYLGQRLRLRYVFIAAIAFLLLTGSAYVTTTNSHLINGIRYWWLQDDAMISMRYAHNLVQGYGLTWNPGEYIEGYSNFLWVMYMALIHLLAPIHQTSFYILATNLILATITLYYLVKLMQQLKGGTVAIICSIAIFVLARPVYENIRLGLETILLTCLVTICLTNILEESTAGYPRKLTFVVIGILPLIRIDAFLFSLWLLCLALLFIPQRKAVLTYTVMALSIFTLHELFRYSYYGEFLPNTAYLKATNWSLMDRLVWGSRYTTGFMVNFLPLLLFSIVSLLIQRTMLKTVSILFIGAYIGYVTYIGGDFLVLDHVYRFFMPILPLVIALASVGIEQVGQTRKITVMGSFAVSILLLQGLMPAPQFDLLQIIYAIAKNIMIGPFPVLLGIMIILAFLPLALSKSWSFGAVWLIVILLLMPNSSSLIFKVNQVEFLWVQSGLKLQESIFENTKLAIIPAGIIPYFSQLYTIDMLGKMDKHVAKSSVTVSGRPGHNKFDYDYSLVQLKPDVVFSTFSGDGEEDLRRAEFSMKLGGPYSSHLLNHQGFQNHCYPHSLFTVSDKSFTFTTFICDWSPLYTEKFKTLARSE